MEFFPAVLSVTAGARQGDPFELPGYMAFMVGSLFGWYRADGRRRFRHAWLELAKGQAKSPLMAALGIYALGWQGIRRSEVYAIAKDREQANVLFQDAAAMCQAPIPGRDGETLESLGQVIIRGTGHMSWMIEHPASRSMFRALAGNEGVNGPRPALVLADEIHEWKSGQAIETWQAAIAKMPGDSLMIMGTNTPGVDQLIGTQYSEVYQSVLSGEIPDDSAFAVIARVDEDDDPMVDESCWQKSMPLLNLTFPRENVRGEVASSQGRIAKAMAVKRLYFGIPVGASEFWIDEDAWDAALGAVTVDDLSGGPVFLSLDLSRKNDLTALGIGGYAEGGRFLARVEYWKPADRLADAQRTDRAPYLEWAEGGVLHAVHGRTIDYAFVAAEVQRLCGSHDVEMMAVDPAFLSDFRRACDDIGLETWVWTPDDDYGSGLKLVIHGQGARGMHSVKNLWMPRSLGILEDMILNRSVMIDDSPLTRWCAGNAAVKPDAQGNRFFVKKRERGRIDGVVALAMLVGAAAGGGASDARSGSYLNEEELLVI